MRFLTSARRAHRHFLGKFLQGINGLIFDWGQVRLQGCSHPRQHFRVNRVGLDPGAAGLGKAAGLQRIDLDQGQTGLPQSRFQCPVIGPGRLEDHPLGLM